jgi:hypothetical protein
MRDIKATPLLNTDPFMHYVESRMKQNCSLTFCYGQIDTTSAGHRTAAEEAIEFPNAVPSSNLLVKGMQSFNSAPSSLSSTGPRIEISVGSDLARDLQVTFTVHRMQTPRSAVGGRRTRPAFGTIHSINRITNKEATHIWDFSQVNETLSLLI